MEVIGPRYPEAEDRCRRLRAILQGVYRREHEMGFGTAESAGKRSLRKYLEAIEGMVPYVAERMLLVGFGGHGLPVDETLRLNLVAEGIIEETADDAEASAVLLRHVKAADALQVHLALQAWTDEVGPPRPTASASNSRRKTSASAAKAASKSTPKPKPASKSKAAPGKAPAAKADKPAAGEPKSAAKSAAKSPARSASSKSGSARSDAAAKSPRKTTTRSAGGRKAAGRASG